MNRDDWIVHNAENGIVFYEHKVTGEVRKQRTAHVNFDPRNLSHRNTPFPEEFPRHPDPSHPPPNNPHQHTHTPNDRYSEQKATSAPHIREEPIHSPPRHPDDDNWYNNRCHADDPYSRPHAYGGPGPSIPEGHDPLPVQNGRQQYYPGVQNHPGQSGRPNEHPSPPFFEFPPSSSQGSFRSQASIAEGQYARFIQCPGLRDLRTTPHQFASNAPPLSYDSHRYVYDSPINAYLVPTKAGYTVRISVSEERARLRNGVPVYAMFKIIKLPDSGNKKVIYHISDGTAVIYEIVSKIQHSINEFCWIREPGPMGRVIVTLHRKTPLAKQKYVLVSLSDISHTGDGAMPVAGGRNYMEIRRSSGRGYVRIEASELVPQRSAGTITQTENGIAYEMTASARVNVALLSTIIVAAKHMNI